MILAGDIGGTHTRLAFFEKGKLVGEKKSYPSQEYSSLEDIAFEFLEGKKVEKACFGVAGPIHDGKAKVTNLTWETEEAHISETLKIPSVHLLNDLESNAYGIEVLKEEDLLLLHEGEEVVGNKALLSAGTGLGEAALVWDGKKHTPFASEGGHASFAPRNDDEIALLKYCQKKFEGHVSYERILSGPGLMNIYEFLIQTGREKENQKVKDEMEKDEPPKVISEWGLKNRDPACTRAVDWFISIYGEQAGNVALHFLSVGGVYLGGGIAPQMVDKIKEGGFYKSFIDKGRFDVLLKKIPVWVILNDNTALLGAANYAENYQ